uniref:Beta-2-microglobulin n=1 Tax=Anoplopoma fimbria TaxID=229290 RepID=C3KIY9_ANOFI|nr:Beta-2-microglobulin precursor [Anoplopoma fimbria]
MKTFVVAFLVGMLCFSASMAKTSPPKVAVYSRLPGQNLKENTLVCHVTGSHPPEVRIELLRNDQVLPGGHQTDLAFEENWHYHLTKHAPFTPNGKDAFHCRVTHMGKTKLYTWEPDM